MRGGGRNRSSDQAARSPVPFSLAALRRSQRRCTPFVSRSPGWSVLLHWCPLVTSAFRVVLVCARLDFSPPAFHIHSIFLASMLE